MIAWAMLIYSPFPINSACLRRSSWNFSLTIRYREKVGLLLETLKTVLKRPNPQFNHTTAALLLLPGNRGNPPRAICCLFVHLLINMPWLGESTYFPAGKRGFGKLHVAAIGRNPHSAGEVLTGSQLSPFTVLLSYLPRWRDGVWQVWDSSWKVTSRISLISSPFIFVLWLWCKGAAVSRTQLAAVPSTEFFEAGCCSQGFPTLFFPSCPDLKSSSENSHLIDEKKLCGLEAVFLDTWDQKGPLEL